MIAAADFDPGRVGDRLARFVDPPFALIDKPGKDQCLSLGAAFGEAAIDEQLVGAALCGQRG
jgi:hypothetical protein